MNTFNINNYVNNFRFKKISPVKILSLQMVSDFNSLIKTEEMFSFILENTEVQVKDTWFPVKEKENYMPVGIDNDISALTEIITHFFNDILKPVFTKSEGSTH